MSNQVFSSAPVTPVAKGNPHTQVAGVFDAIMPSAFKSDQQKLEEKYEQKGFDFRVRYLASVLPAGRVERDIQTIRFGLEGKRLWKEAESLGCLDAFQRGVERGSQLVADQFNKQQASAGKPERMYFNHPRQPIEMPTFR